ncbi:MAG TPA: polysaccharide deacetylase family protein, partial [Nitrososphaeraceae archaeon]|nr:polysaccharide deacetylase family protein [Nitrososphaeraceae archaeon]
MTLSSSRYLFILTLAILLMSIGTYSVTGIDAEAKKIKTSTSAGKTNSSKHKPTSQASQPTPRVDSSSNNKLVIINFDDSHESDYTYAKPILDKYGFKATFFEVCNWVEAGSHDNDVSVTWPEIAALQQDGMDIEAHTMNHPNLNDLSSQADLDYEIGQSKQCLENHGFNPTIFAYPNGKGSDDSKVVNTVAKYYDLARTDTKSSALSLLQCGGDVSGNVNNQQQRVNCGISLNDGKVIPENRYSINSWAHKHIEEGCSANNSANTGSAGTCVKFRFEYNNAQMFQKFLSAVNSQNTYNKDGAVRAIPIIVYHILVNYPDLSDSNRPIDTTVNLFDAEMRYLYDNGFKV